MKIIIILTLSTLLQSTILSAQILTPAQWSYKTSKEKIDKGKIVELTFIVKLDKNWHLYSTVQNYELGPLPTVLEFQPHSSYQLIGIVQPIGAKKEYDGVFEVHVNYFEDTGEFRQKIKILSKSPVIKGTYEYQICSTIDGKCIMGNDEFIFNIQ